MRLSDAELGLRLETAAAEFRRAAEDLDRLCDLLPRRAKAQRVWAEQISARLRSHADALVAEVAQPDRESTGLLARLGRRRLVMLSMALTVWAGDSVVTGALEAGGSEIFDGLSRQIPALVAFNDELDGARSRASDRIGDALHELDSTQRRVIEMKYGIAQNEVTAENHIGDELGLTTDAVRYHVREGLNRLEASTGMVRSDLLEALRQADSI